LLLLCAVGSDAFTYTCNEVKELIRKNTTIYAGNACIALDEFIPTDSGFTTEVYFLDGTGRGRYSFAQVSTLGCIPSSLNSWKIVTEREDEGEGIDCSYEFTVLFSSMETHLITAKGDSMHHRSYQAYNMTVVNPRGGILIDFSCNNTQQPLHFYTGLGNGASEQMYYYGSSKCDERLTVFAWDTAITINTPDNGYILITYWGTGGYLSLGSVSYDVLLMGSGRSSNIVQHGDEDKFIWLSPSLSDDLKFHVDGFADMDSKLGNSLVFTAKCKENNCTETTAPITDRDIHMVLEADFLAVNYNTKVADDQWKDDDLFFMRIASTPLDAPEVTVAPPVKANTDYSCNCDLVNGKADFSSDLWLDIVFLIDVSHAMGAEKINKATAVVDSIVASLTLDTQSPRFSRVGLVAVSNKAEVIDDFSSPFKTPTNLQPTTADGADIRSGFVSALSIFAKSSHRSARQLIYIIAASDSSPLTIEHATDFKNKGGIIAVTEVDSTASEPLLRDLASPGYYNINFNDNTNTDLQLLCDANCFCSSGFTAFYKDQYSRVTGDRGCYQIQSTTDAYELARDACQDGGSLLTTVHDEDKQNFLISFLSSKYGPKKPFWIGYEYNGHDWEWIDDSTSPYSKWGSGQPDVKDGRCAFSLQTTGFNSAWFAGDCSTDKYFICERAPCTVNNVCK
ncbi:hypothetical protein PFISCL1PPCAC_2463, partial [Pristionchus fissidentatus]